MSIRKKSDGKWQIDYYPQGRKGKRCRKTFVGSEADARQYELELRRQNASPSSQIVNPKVNDVIPEYLRWLKLHRTETTYIDVKKSLKTLLPHFGKLQFPRITHTVVEKYKELRREQNPKLSGRTINKELIYFQAIVKFAVKNNYANPLPFKIEKLPHNRPIPRIPHPTEIISCAQPEGYVLNNDDCHDGDAFLNPNTVWYEDSDKDLFGNPLNSLAQCKQPLGYVLNKKDCDDTDPLVSPATIWYKDSDGDNYSDGIKKIQCQQPDGYKLELELISITGDCNDSDNTEHDKDATWYKDQDNDGYSDGAVVPNACNRPPGYKLPLELTATSGDCDDTSAELTPTLTWYQDNDNDGFGSPLATKTQCSHLSGYVLNNKDCDDADFSVHSNMKEVCGDSIDQDCDGGDLVKCPTYPQVTIGFLPNTSGSLSSVISLNSPDKNLTKNISLFYRPLNSTIEYTKIVIDPANSEWLYELPQGVEYYIRIEDNTGNVTQTPLAKTGAVQQGDEVNTPTLNEFGVMMLVMVFLTAFYRTKSFYNC